MSIDVARRSRGQRVDVDRALNVSQGRIRRPLAGRAEDSYAFQVTAYSATQVAVRWGYSYLVNETPVRQPPGSDLYVLLDVPSTDGTYVVFLKVTYGIGEDEGVWDELDIAEVGALPDEFSGDLLVARVFRIASVVVASNTWGPDDINRHWKLGDVFGDPPYICPVP